MPIRYECEHGITHYDAGLLSNAFKVMQKEVFIHNYAHVCCKEYCCEYWNYYQEK